MFSFISFYSSTVKMVSQLASHSSVQLTSAIFMGRFYSTRANARETGLTLYAAYHSICMGVGLDRAMRMRPTSGLKNMTWINVTWSFFSLLPDMIILQPSAKCTLAASLRTPEDTCDSSVAAVQTSLVFCIPKILLCVSLIEINFNLHKQQSPENEMIFHVARVFTELH